jgi:hypothetical protein
VTAQCPWPPQILQNINIDSSGTLAPVGNFRVDSVLMRRRLAVSTMAAAAIGFAQPPTPKARLTGTWRLVSCVRTHGDGSKSLPWGENPVGQIIYLDNGRMSAQIMRPGRHSTVPPGIDYGSSQATEQEIREAVNGFVSYFGTYSVDESANKVTHNLEAALVPTWVGTSLVRAFQIDWSGKLTLMREVPGEKDVLVWRRMAD